VHDSRRLFIIRGPRRPDRLGAGRIGGASSGATRQCAGASRRWLELRKGRGSLGSLDDDTIRKWRDLFVEEGIEGLAGFEAGAALAR
jgi:hypothetical protein